jgi:peptidoglycan/LPS O-acetylase OafA/YrhL
MPPPVPSRPPVSERISPRLSNLLNAARWISAFAVVFGHLCNIILDKEAPAHDWLPYRVLIALSGFSHGAVIVFFVLSGFLVGGSVLTGLHEGRFQFTSYLISRISRLYTVLVVAILLGGVLDLLGIQWLNQSHYYDRPDSVLWYSVRANLDWSILLGNLLSCQTILTPTLGSNSPLWSLANEFWYYMLWPALLLAWPRRGKYLGNAGALLVAILLIILLPRSILVYFSVWVLGAMLFAALPTIIRLAPRGLHARWAWCIFLVTGVGCYSSPSELFFARHLHGMLAIIVPDLVFSSAFCLLVIAVASRSEQRESPLAPFHQRMADFSYSVYLGHHPLIVFLVAAIHGLWEVPFKLPPGLLAFSLVFALIPLIYLYSYGIYFVTERNTASVRSWLKQRLMIPLWGRVEAPRGAGSGA